MSRFKLKMAGGDSSDLAAYDKMARTAKKRGFDVMSMWFLAETTREQEEADLDDRWLRFSANCPSLMKVAETGLVHGVLSKAHIEKNVELAREKSKILAKNGLAGTVWILEPMWLPESFYAKHPETRGARCDNPCISLGDYYSPCLDNEEVLEHYREATRKLLEARAAAAGPESRHQRLGRRHLLVQRALSGQERPGALQARSDGNEDAAVVRGDTCGREGRAAAVRGRVQPGTLQPVRDEGYGRETAEARGGRAGGQLPGCDCAFEAHEARGGCVDKSDARRLVPVAGARHAVSVLLRGAGEQSDALRSDDSRGSRPHACGLWSRQRVDDGDTGRARQGARVGGRGGQTGPRNREEARGAAPRAGACHGMAGGGPRAQALDFDAQRRHEPSIAPAVLGRGRPLAHQADSAGAGSSRAGGEGVL